MFIIRWRGQRFGIRTRHLCLLGFVFLVFYVVLWGRLRIPFGIPISKSLMNGQMQQQDSQHEAQHQPQQEPQDLPQQKTQHQSQQEIHPQSQQEFPHQSQEVTYHMSQQEFQRQSWQWPQTASVSPVNDAQAPNTLGLKLPSFQSHLTNYGLVPSPTPEGLSGMSLFWQEHADLQSGHGSKSIYGSTIYRLDPKRDKLDEHEQALRPVESVESDTPATRLRFAPYPSYNSPEWLAEHEKYVPCSGPAGRYVQDTIVFDGQPVNFPAPSFGSYTTLGIDDALCFERTTRLSLYGFPNPSHGLGVSFDWGTTPWGKLQQMCVKRNEKRFRDPGHTNRSLGRRMASLDSSAHGREDGMKDEHDSERGLSDRWRASIGRHAGFRDKSQDEDSILDDESWWRQEEGFDRSISDRGDIREDEHYSNHLYGLLDHQMASPDRYANALGDHDKDEQNREQSRDPHETRHGKTKEPRTAVLLRSYTGRVYTDNDKQIIRSLIMELCLRSGGEYQVFLFVQSKTGLEIAEEGIYKHVMDTEVPEEFRNITMIWDDDLVESIYPALKAHGPEGTDVHNAQFLPVQIFSQGHPEFEFIWNWEIDTRLVGHNYDIVTKLAQFAKKQPRRGLWERNERFYIPSIHGDYDTEFRTMVEQLSGDDTIWGSTDFDFVVPAGPKPPVAHPEQDAYQWGVGEDANLITLSPIFNPQGSNWILRNQVWGFPKAEMPPSEFPRRATINTHSRLSKRLLDTMHAENIGGNHLGSEMVAQTIAMLHGFKAVYAPMPVFFDRPWSGPQLARWFNGGPKDTSGGPNSAIDWGQEGRFEGATWYFRASPPQRLYNHWLGHEDMDIGGKSWEEKYGRTCLPVMMLHPVKESLPMSAGRTSESGLPYEYR